MKKLLLPAICIILLAGCAPTPPKSIDKHAMDIFTVTDNGITLRDTVFREPGGSVIARDLETPTIMVGDDTTTVEGSTSRFTPDVDKKMSFDTSHSAVYVCTLHKTKDYAQFSVIFNLNRPVALTLLNLAGPASGIGTFRLTPGISAIDPKLRNVTDLQPCASYSVYISGGQSYKVDSAEVNITRAEGTTIDATYKLWVANNGSSKTVTGTINYNFAKLD